MSIFRIYSSCEKGPRDNIEDSYDAVTLKNSTTGKKIFIADTSDGVGGNNYGEVASGSIVKAILSYLCGMLVYLIQNAVPDNIIDYIIESFNIANNSILQQIEKKPELKGMSTTSVCAVIIDDTLYTAWAGDSRCYLYSSGHLKQITTDHSMTQSLIDKGLLDPSKEKSHPLAHTITQYVGMDKGFKVETRICKLSYGDIVILATDGLTDVVSNSQIEEYINEYQRGVFAFRQLPHFLTKKALSLGSTDNVTVLCTEYLPDRNQDITIPDFTLTGAYPVELARTLKSLNMES